MSLIFCAGSIPRTFFKPFFKKGLRNVPSFDAKNYLLEKFGCAGSGEESSYSYHTDFYNDLSTKKDILEKQDNLNIIKNSYIKVRNLILEGKFGKYFNIKTVNMSLCNTKLPNLIETIFLLIGIRFFQ